MTRPTSHLQLTRLALGCEGVAGIPTPQGLPWSQ